MYLNAEHIFFLLWAELTIVVLILILYFKQMMYVSGETAEASAETTGMIEEIVRQQVIEMVCV